mmetsp:Transcript_47409/g.125111  ORF Transcript_47409/g.125111 Transcript_47409/m.125111 type:complete len:335 (+) Transcript_47409:634-1638(+)
MPIHRLADALRQGAISRRQPERAEPGGLGCDQHAFGSHGAEHVEVATLHDLRQVCEPRRCIRQPALVGEVAHHALHQIRVLLLAALPVQVAALADVHQAVDRSLASEALAQQAVVALASVGAAAVLIQGGDSFCIEAAQGAPPLGVAQRGHGLPEDLSRVLTGRAVEGHVQGCLQHREGVRGEAVLYGVPLLRERVQGAVAGVVAQLAVWARHGEVGYVRTLERLRQRGRQRRELRGRHVVGGREVGSLVAASPLHFPQQRAALVRGGQRGSAVAAVASALVAAVAAAVAALCTWEFGGRRGSRSGSRRDSRRGGRRGCLRGRCGYAINREEAQ